MGGSRRERADLGSGLASAAYKLHGYGTNPMPTT